MNCTYCAKPIKLRPSAQERARIYGGSPVDYISRFTMHADCAIESRQKESIKLVRRLTREAKAKRVSFPAS